MREYKRKVLPLSKIKANQQNPRIISESKLKKLVNSLLVFPKMMLLRPITVDEDNFVLGGNMRQTALGRIAQMTLEEIQVHLEQLPEYNDLPDGGHEALEFWEKFLEKPQIEVQIAEGLSDDEKQQFIIKDNVSYGDWDYDELEKWDAEKLEGWGVETQLPDFGFDIEDLPRVTFPGADGKPVSNVNEKPAEEDDFDPDAHYETKVKAGEVWQLGEHRLMCGDSTDADAVAKLMNGERADMVLSDPPYGMKLDTDFSSIKGSLNSIGRKNHTEGNKYERVIGDNDDFTPALITTFFENFGYCQEVFLFGADYFAEILPNKNDGSWLVWDKRKESQADAIGAEFELIWSKTKHKRRMLRHDWFGFLSSQNGADARNRVHPTQKPVTLLADIITQWGKDANIIVDLYGGSGSTMIACEQLGRKCRMMELDPHYCTVIIARWEKLTGQKAVKLNL